jgi:glycosyltransferase involved in cell wall biosynthesis
MSPRVSIGVPVYNGENYLAKALDSILSQTFTDLEVVISDNASTDSTAAICEEYQQRDSRIRYYRSEKNLGGIRNFNRVFELSKGEFFQWVAHDDEIAPQYLEHAVAIFDQHPEVVLCYARAYRINENERVGPIDFKPVATNASVKARLHDVIFTAHLCIPIAGVVRASALKETRCHMPFVGSDWNLLVELALIGQYYEIPDYFYLRRSHPLRSVKVYTKHERIVWSDPSKAKNLNFPTWRQNYEYFRSIRRARLSFRERLQCYRVILKWLSLRPTLHDLNKDLRMAMKKMILGTKLGTRIYNKQHQRSAEIIVIYILMMLYQ